MLTYLKKADLGRCRQIRRPEGKGRESQQNPEQPEPKNPREAATPPPKAIELEPKWLRKILTGSINDREIWS